eukprot:CAMPEP_0177682574 /NCGR_PEP_ID=MMETSP0447-20121125/31329_1 /TAXON_ID=0 /ORGANISM="Stygamoeba regulata, Strain BSH-02190019" /LENGTH=832 /DNA_ID=CAMNT_0019192081 /DNA_START=130 /DNA_END=2628 /DNA_ORIENTATION=+
MPGEEQQFQPYYVYEQAVKPGEDCPAARKEQNVTDVNSSGSSTPDTFIRKYDVRVDYQLLNIIGKGGFAVVRKAICKADNKEVAVKIIDKSKSGMSTLTMLQAEIDIMAKVNHKHVVHLDAIYETQKYLFLAMELVTGGPLIDKVINRGYLTEKEAAIVTRQLLEAIDYLHSIGVVHRDLKPENLLCSVPGIGTIGDIKVTDFGLSKLMTGSRIQTRSQTKKAVVTSLKSMCGTPNYFAPEVVTGAGYGEQVDAWAAGVILYILLSGCFPYSGEKPELYHSIVNEDPDFDDDVWQQVSDSAKDLVLKLMNKNQMERPTAREALAHPWLKLARQPGESQILRAASQRLKGTWLQHLKREGTNEDLRSKEAIGPNQTEEERDEDEEEKNKTFFFFGAKEDGTYKWDDERDWPQLLSCARQATFQKGDVIVQEGSKNSRLYKVKTGVVQAQKVDIRSSDGKAVVLRYMADEEMFGELSLLDPEGITSVSVIASSDSVTLYEMEFRRLLKWLDADPELAARFFKMIALEQARRLTSNRRILMKLLGTTVPAPSHDVDKVADRKNQKLIATILSSFNMPDTTKIILTAPCSWKKTPGHLIKGAREGHVFLTEKSVLLFSRVFAFSMKACIDYQMLGDLAFFSETNCFFFTVSEEEKHSYTIRLPKASDFDDIKAAILSKREAAAATPGATAKLVVADDENLGLLAEDIEAMLRGAEVVTFRPGDYLITEGSEKHKLFYISNGQCHIEILRPEDDCRVIIGNVGKHELLGDISFLMQTGASASVVADEEVIAYMIEGDHIHSLFSSTPGFAHRFFRYLATITSMRLKRRVQESNKHAK